MKIKQEKILFPVQNSFKALRYKVPEFKMQFHHHTEYELVYIVSGSGLRYIGNSVQKFSSGDMIFLGPNLGHMWVSGKENQQKGAAEAIVIQFSEKMIASLLVLPEFRRIQELLNKADFGLRIFGKSRKLVLKKVTKLLGCKGPDAIILLLEILKMLSESSELACLNLSESSGLSKDKRINAVYQYVKAFYTEKITVQQAASLANMEKSAFCRFFKEKTNKTFSRFLNETRVDQACQLLLKKEIPVSRIAFDCGFNNMANFYRQFKKITGQSPGEYSKSV